MQKRLSETMPLRPLPPPEKKSESLLLKHSDDNEIELLQSGRP